MTVEKSFGDYHILIMFGIAIILGVFFGKETRKSLFIPAVLITIAALNPFLKKIIDDNDGGNVYWRALWLIPILNVCAGLPAFAVGRAKKLWTCVVIISLATVVIIESGSFVYANDVFQKSTNAEKLPTHVERVAQRLLNMDDSPRVVADSGLSVYLRQYSGKIQMPYARSVTYGTPSSLGREMHEKLGNREYKDLATLMGNYDYEYLVTDIWVDGKHAELEKAGYELLEEVDQYGIYRVHGERTESRDYNEKGQVTRLTYVNPDGNAVSGPSGYATSIYDYDKLGRLIYEFHLDENGKGVVDSNNHAGYRYERNQDGLITKTFYYGADGETAKNGCAERIYKYDDKKIIEEMYLDWEGNPINVGIGYARIVHEYKGNQLSLSYFYSADGTELDCGSGYFHKYLRGLIERKDEDTVIFISIKDEGTNALTVTLQDDLYDLGIGTYLLGKYRNSYYAIITNDEVLEDISENVIERSGSIRGVDYVIVSGGNNTTGDISSIQINGVENSKNYRGMNIVIVEDGKVIDTVRFDTFSQDMAVMR